MKRFYPKSALIPSLIDLVQAQLRRRIAQEFYHLDKKWVKVLSHEDPASALLRSLQDDPASVKPFSRSHISEFTSRPDLPVYNLSAIFANASEEEADQLPAIQQVLSLVLTQPQTTYALLRDNATAPLCIALYRWLLWTDEAKQLE